MTGKKSIILPLLKNSVFSAMAIVTSILKSKLKKITIPVKIKPGILLKIETDYVISLKNITKPQE